jgi:hypothetical protein
MLLFFEKISVPLGWWNPDAIMLIASIGMGLMEKKTLMKLKKLEIISILKLEFMILG